MLQTGRQRWNKQKGTPGTTAASKASVSSRKFSNAILCSEGDLRHSKSLHSAFSCLFHAYVFRACFAGLELDRLAPCLSRRKSHKLSAMSLLLLKRHRSFDDQRCSVGELGSSKWSFATALAGLKTVIRKFYAADFVTTSDYVAMASTLTAASLASAPVISCKAGALFPNTHAFEVL